jgi:heptosyltransferase-2
VVLTTGLLTALAARFGPVDVVTTPAALALVETHPAVRRAIAWDKRGAERGVRGLWRLARRLMRERYARAYLPHRSLRSAALALLAEIPERVGFAGGAGALTYTRSVARPTEGHEAERLLALAESAGNGPAGAGAPGRAAVGLTLTRDDRRAAEEWLARHGVAPGFVALAPGSIWGTKRWPYYAELARTLDRPLVIVGSGEDRELGLEVAAAAPERTSVAAGELPLRGSAALLERAALLVTNDSAPLHLASAVGTPVVAIFGPTVPGFGFGPRGPRDRIVQHPALSCRPCSSHGPRVCPLLHHRCMKEVAVARVREAVEAELREQSTVNGQR